MALSAPLWMIAAALFAHSVETAAIARTLTSPLLVLYRIGIAGCVLAALVEAFR